MVTDIDEIHVPRKKLEDIVYIFKYLESDSPRNAAPYHTLGLEASHNPVFQVLVHGGYVHNVPGTDSFFLASDPLLKSRNGSQRIQITRIRSIKETLEELDLSSSKLENLGRYLPFAFMVLFMLIFLFMLMMP